MPTRNINANLLLANLRYIDGKAESFISDMYTHLLLSSREIFDFIIVEKEVNMLDLERAVLAFIKKIIILIQEKRYDEANKEIIQLGRRHFEYRVPLEFYSLFAVSFIHTMKQYLGIAWTRESERHWRITFLIFISLIQKGYGL